MAQLGLFAVRTPLLDGERGTVTYQPDVVPIERADIWFEHLKGGIDWHAQRRVMYEREVDVPRLTAHFRLADFDDEAVPGIDQSAAGVIRAAAGLVRDVVGVPFNSIGLNFYRDGSDSVAPHSDRLGDLVAGCPIALLSLGDTRRMLIRSKRPGEAAVPIDLEAGSLLVMSHSIQLHYTHGIAKTRAVVGPRISLAFRMRPE